MKKLLPFIIALSVFGCDEGNSCIAGKEPTPRFGTPDDEYRISSHGGYESYTYAYYCYEGMFLSFTYVRQDDCSDYVLDSTYQMTGFCDLNE